MMRSAHPSLALLSLLVGAILILGFLPQPARAQLDPFEKVQEKKGPINITADQLEYDKEHKIVTASGHARAVQQDFSMEAEKIIYYDLEHKLEGVGNVVMMEAGNSYRADRMVIDTEAETGVLFNGEVYLELGNFLLCGQQVEKLPDEHYLIDDGIYTTCSCPPDQKPSWTLKGTTMDVNVGSYGSVTNAVLNAKGIPVFYFPKFIFPAPRERQSGFLFPDIFYTSRKGFVTSLPFYWAIAKNVDATIEPRFIQLRGVGGDTELRYILSRRGRGEASLSYLNEFLFERVAPPDPTVAKRRKLGDLSVEAPSVDAFKPSASLERWEFKASHSQEWTSTLHSGASIHILSDELYWELASRRLDKGRPFTTSTVTTSKGWPGTGLTVTVRYFQDLVPTRPPRCKSTAEPDFGDRTVNVDRAHGTCELIYELDRPLTYQKFPEVKFGTSLFDRDLAPLALGLNSEVIRFYRFPNEPIPEWKLNQLGSPVEAYRMILTPNTGLPYDLWGYFSGSFRFETDQYVYYVPVYQSGTTQTFSVLRPTAEIRTSLVRQYKIPIGPIRKIRHEVQPTVRYRLVNPVSLPNRIAFPVTDTDLLEPLPPPDIPEEPGGPGPGLHSFGLFAFDGRDGAAKEELIEVELRNQFPTTYINWKGQETGISPFELKLTQPISVNELKRQDVKASALRGGYESHYKYNLSGYQRQKQAEQMGLVLPAEKLGAPPREVGDIVPLEDEHRPLMPLIAELRSRAIEKVDIQIQAKVDPYYGREFQSITTFLGTRDRFRFRRLGMKYTFTPRSLKPQNGPVPDSANRDNPFFVHSHYLEPRVRFYLHPRFVIGGDASYNVGVKSLYYRGGFFGWGGDDALHRTGLTYGAGSIEYFSACRCWSAFFMVGRRLIGKREDFTLQAVVDENGQGVSNDDWILQFGINLQGLIALGQNPDEQ